MKPTPGDQRIRKFFPIFPYMFKGKIYWLKTVEVCEWYHRLNWGGAISDGFGWEVISVINDNVKKNDIYKYFPKNERTGKGYGYDFDYIMTL